jgi:hypothetical protein
MTRREFVPLAASLAVSAITAQLKAGLEIEGKGWRVVFDTTGRIRSFKGGQTGVVNSRHAHVQSRILFPCETVNVFDQPAKVSRLASNTASPNLIRCLFVLNMN